MQILLSEEALRSVAMVRPTTVEQLAKVPAVPLRVAERFGPSLLCVVAEYCRSTGLQPQSEQRASAVAAPAPAQSSEESGWRALKRTVSATAAFSNPRAADGTMKRPRKLPVSFGKR